MSALNYSFVCFPLKLVAKWSDEHTWEGLRTDSTVTLDFVRKYLQKYFIWNKDLFKTYFNIYLYFILSGWVCVSKGLRMSPGCAVRVGVTGTRYHRSEKHRAAVRGPFAISWSRPRPLNPLIQCVRTLSRTSKGSPSTEFSATRNHRVSKRETRLFMSFLTFLVCLCLRTS